MIDLSAIATFMRSQGFIPVDEQKPKIPDIGYPEPEEKFRDLDNFMLGQGFLPKVQAITKPALPGEFAELHEFMKRQGYQALNEPLERPIKPPQKMGPPIPPEIGMARAQAPQPSAALKPAGLIGLEETRLPPLEQPPAEWAPKVGLAKIGQDAKTYFYAFSDAMMRGLTLGNFDFDNLGKRTRELFERREFVPKGKAMEFLQTWGSLLGGMAPIGAAFAIGGPAGAAATRIPMAQAAIRATVAGTLTGLARKPTEDNIVNRLKQIPADVLLYGAFETAMLTEQQLYAIARYNKEFGKGYKPGVFGEYFERPVGPAGGARAEPFDFSAREMKDIYNKAAANAQDVAQGRQPSMPFTPKEQAILDQLVGNPGGWRQFFTRGARGEFEVTGAQAREWGWQFKPETVPRKPRWSDIFRDPNLIPAVEPLTAEQRAMPAERVMGREEGVPGGVRVKTIEPNWGWRAGPPPPRASGAGPAAGVPPTPRPTGTPRPSQPPSAAAGPGPAAGPPPPPAGIPPAAAPSPEAPPPAGAPKGPAPPKIKVTPNPDGGWTYEIVPTEPHEVPPETKGVPYDTTAGRKIPPEPRPGAGPGERAIPRPLGPGQPLDARFGSHLTGSFELVRKSPRFKQGSPAVENASFYIQKEFNDLPESAKNWFLDQLDSGKIKLKVWTDKSELPTPEGGMPFPYYTVKDADAFTWNKNEIYVNPLKLEEFYGDKIPPGMLSHEILHTAIAEIGSKNPEQVEFYKKQIAALSLPYIKHLEKSYTEQLPPDHPDYFADMIYSSMLDISRNVPDPKTQQRFLHDMIVKALSVRMNDPLGPAKVNFFRRWRELRGIQPGPVSARDRQAILLSYIHTIYERLGIASELGDFGFHELMAYTAMTDPAMVDNLFKPLRPGAPKAGLPEAKTAAPKAPEIKPLPEKAPAPPPPKEVPPPVEKPPPSEIKAEPTPANIPPTGIKPSGPWKIFTRVHGTRDADIVAALEARPEVSVKTVKFDRAGYRTLMINGPEKRNVLAVGKWLQRAYGKRVTPVRPEPWNETIDARANLFGRIRSNFMILDKQPMNPAKVKAKVSKWKDDLYGFIKSVGGIKPGGAFGRAEFKDLNLPPGIVRKTGSSAEDIYSQALDEGLIHHHEYGDARDLYAELQARKEARGRPPIGKEEPMPDEYEAVRRLDALKAVRAFDKDQFDLNFVAEADKPKEIPEKAKPKAEETEAPKITEAEKPPEEKIQRSEITARALPPVILKDELQPIPNKEEMREFEDAQFDLFNEPGEAPVPAPKPAAPGEPSKVEEAPSGPPLFLPDDEVMNYAIKTLNDLKSQFIKLANGDYFNDRFLDLVAAFQGKDVSKMENYARVLLSKRGLRRMVRTYDEKGRITGYVPRDPEQLPIPSGHMERPEELLPREEPVFQGEQVGPEESLHIEAIEKANKVALEKTLEDFRYIAQENDFDFEILKETYLNGLSLRQVAEKLRSAKTNIARRLEVMNASGQIAQSAGYRRYLETKIILDRELEKHMKYFHAGIAPPTSKIEAMELWENIKRLVLTGRGLPKEIEHAADQRINEFVAHKFMATVEARELNRWIVKENGNNPRVRAYVLDVLTGEEDPNYGYLPDKTRDLLIRMRGQLDLLSQQILANVVPKTPEERSLINSIERNLGHYLGRFYKLHEYNLKYARRKWLRRYYHPTPEVREAFKRRLLEDHPRIFGSLSNRDMEDYLDSIIRGKPFQYQYQGGRRKSIPTKHFIRRKQLPQEWKDFLGEIEDPVYLYIRTIVDMASMAYNAKFLNQVFSGYEGKLWSRTLVPAWKNYTLPDELRWGKMRGTYLHPALYEFMKFELIPMVDATSRAIEQFVINPFKLSKTVFSVPTHARNFLGNLMFSMLNRNLILNPTNWRFYLKASNVYLNRNKILGPGRGADAWNELVRRGVTETQYYGAEVPKIYERLMRLDPETWWDYLGRFPRWTLAKLGGAYNFEDALYRIAAYYKDIEHFGMTPTEAVEEVNRSMTNYRKLPAVVDWLRKWPVLGPFVSFKWNVGKILANQMIEGINEIRAGAGYGPPKYRSARRGGPFGNVPSPEAEAGSERMKDRGMFWDGMRRLWRVAMALAIPKMIKEAVERYYEIDQEKIDKIEKFYPDFLRQGIFVYWRDDQNRIRQIDLSNIWPTGELAELLKALKKGDLPAGLKVLNVAESPLFDLWALLRGIDPATLEKMDAGLLRRAGYGLQRIFLPASLPVPSGGTIRQLITTGKFEPRAGILTTNQIKRLIDAYWGEGLSGTKLPEELRAFFTGVRSYVVDPERVLDMALRSARKELDEERRGALSWSFKNTKAPAWQIADKKDEINARLAKLAAKIREIQELQKYFRGGKDAGR